MNNCKNGNPKKKSRFICLKCLNYKTTCIDGVQRKNQRESGHIKDNVCIRCGNVQTMEIRYCDYLPDVMKKAIIKHNELYEDNVEYVDTDFYGKIYI
jgi:hypothetical protein